MAILVTMQVGPVDWSKFKAAIDTLKGSPAPGRKSSEVYRNQSDPGVVLIVETWDSHDAMNAYQEKVGDDFNEQAGTAGMHWETGLWEFAESM
jgi:quinol monooxygenase YgiN